MKNSFIDNSDINSGLVLQRVGLGVLASFFLISFESKALMNLLGSLSLLLSFIYIYKYDKKIFQSNQFLIFFIISYIAGFLFGFLSDSGAVGAFAFLDRFKFMLLVLPLTAFVRKRKDLHLLLAMFFISAIIAICYGIYKQQPYGSFHGFHKIGRTADMMSVAFLTVLVYLVQSKFIFEVKSISLKIFLLLATILFGWAVVMSEMRGSWLGLALGLIAFTFILLLFNRKTFIYKSILSI